MKKEIQNKLEYLKKYVNNLKELKMHSLEELKKDFTISGAVERYLQLSLECVIDICQIIISKENLRKPENYKEIIPMLAEVKIFTRKFAVKFAPAIGLRNILVHHYAKIDLNKLYKNLQEDIKDFDSFAKAIAKYLEKK